MQYIQLVVCGLFLTVKCSCFFYCRRRPSLLTVPIINIYLFVIQNESTDEDCQEAERGRERWKSDNISEETEHDKTDSIPPEPLHQIPETSVEMEMTSEPSTETYKKVLELSSEQLVWFQCLLLTQTYYFFTTEYGKTRINYYYRFVLNLTSNPKACVFFLKFLFRQV